MKDLLSPPKHDTKNRPKRGNGGGSSDNGNNSNGGVVNIILILLVVGIFGALMFGGGSSNEMYGNMDGFMDEVKKGAIASVNYDDPGGQRHNTEHPPLHENDADLDYDRINEYLEDSYEDERWLVWICITESDGFYACESCPGGKIRLSHGDVYAVLLFPESQEIEMFATCVTNLLTPKERYRGEKTIAVDVYNKILSSMPNTPPANL